MAETAQQSQDAPASPPMQLLLRPPAVPPTDSTIDIRPSRRILIYHPHYKYGNCLLNLFAPDHPSGGLQHEFVAVICGIITGNRWDGWFTRTRDGPRITMASNEILRCGKYFFHLENSSDETPYPVIPIFREWTFPHNDLPRSWASLDAELPPSRILATSAFSNAIQVRDFSCRLTGYSEVTQAAHLVPQIEDEWYKQNDMGRYAASPFARGAGYRPRERAAPPRGSAYRV